jgi:PASTA domain
VFAGGIMLAAATSLVTWPVGPASASTTFTATSYYVPLTYDLQVPPNNSDIYPPVLTADITMQAGETRRITDRLGVTLTSSEGAEVDNRIVCLDWSTGTAQEIVRTSAGTNHQGSAAGELGLSVSMLFTAPHAGTFQCQIQAQTSDGSRTDYYMTVLKSGMPYTATGTWLKISSADEAGSHAWWNNTCDSRGTFASCVYLGGSGDPQVSHIFVDGVPPQQRDIWTAGNDTTNVDMTGTFQITSCPNGTSSCRSDQWGDGGIFGINKTTYAEVESYLEFNQLYPDGSVCRINQSFDPDTANVYYISNSVHHLPITYHISAPVSPNCGGSRQFAPELVYQWIGGNPVKIDGGNVSVINSVRATTTTVPYVLGSTEAQAGAAIQAEGLTADTVDRVINPAPAGTVFAENSPGGTVEPTGSQVQISVSLGEAWVPNVLSYDQSSAMDAITAAGLTVGNVSHINNCVDPGTVQIQNPNGGVTVTPGTPVNIEVSTCTSGGGGGGGGNPILPK